MTQPEYIKEISAAWDTHIATNRKNFINYGYNNHTCCDNIRAFLINVKERLGLSVSNCYHAHGIGNNNEYTIFKQETDEDGFSVDKKIAELYYCYGIFGGCQIRLTDLNTGELVRDVGRAY